MIVLSSSHSGCIVPVGGEYPRRFSWSSAGMEYIIIFAFYKFIKEYCCLLFKEIMRVRRFFSPLFEAGLGGAADRFFEKKLARAR